MRKYLQTPGLLSENRTDIFTCLYIDAVQRFGAGSRQ